MRIICYIVIHASVPSQAVARYQALAALLRGEAPRGFLLPVPRGYIAMRARQLAQGPVLKARAALVMPESLENPKM